MTDEAKPYTEAELNHLAILVDEENGDVYGDDIMTWRAIMGRAYVADPILTKELLYKGGAVSPKVAFLFEASAQMFQTLYATFNMLQETIDFNENLASELKARYIITNVPAIAVERLTLIQNMVHVALRMATVGTLKAGDEIAAQALTDLKT